MTFNALNIVFCSGGTQSLPKSLNEIGLDPKQERFFVSDEILKWEGFYRFWNYILENNIEEIDIIGGSHSGFSVAWMLLNGSAMFDYSFENIGELPLATKYTSDKFYIGEDYDYEEWRL